MGDVFFFYVLYEFDAVFDGCVILGCYVGSNSWSMCFASLYAGAVV